MYYQVYKITNVHTNKIYIGSHKSQDLNDGYFGSGIYLKRAIKKHGIESFKKEIICLCESENEMREKEAELLRRLKDEKNHYNLKFDALGGNTRILYTEEQKKQYVNKLIANPDSPIGKRGEDAFNYGTIVSEEVRKKQSESHLKRWDRIKQDDKYSSYRKILSENAKSNLEKINKERMVAIKLKDLETGKIHSFNSMKEAAKALDIPHWVVMKLRNGCSPKKGRRYQVIL